LCYEDEQIERVLVGVLGYLPTSIGEGRGDDLSGTPAVTEKAQGESERAVTREGVVNESGNPSVWTLKV
jgi:hypothetical protein